MNLFYRVQENRKISMAIFMAIGLLLMFIGKGAWADFGQGVFFAALILFVIALFKRKK